MYCNKFFGTEEEAKLSRSLTAGRCTRTSRESHSAIVPVEAMMAVQGGWLRSAEVDSYPFCVAWNGKPLSAGKEI